MDILHSVEPHLASRMKGATRKGARSFAGEEDLRGGVWHGPLEVAVDLVPRHLPAGSRLTSWLPAWHGGGAWGTWQEHDKVHGATQGARCVCLPSGLCDLLIFDSPEAPMDSWIPM